MLARNSEAGKGERDSSFDVRGGNSISSYDSTQTSSFDEDSPISAPTPSSSEYSTSVPSSAPAIKLSPPIPDALPAPSTSDFDDDEDDSRCSFNDPVRHPHVYFKHVLIRNYGSTMSDNPSVSCGPPVGLAWSYAVIPPICIEDFEIERDGFGLNGELGKRVTVDEYARLGRIFPEDRLQTCLNGGYTIEEVEEAVRTVRDIQAK